MKELVDKWWVIALRGVLGIVLGLILITYPVKSLVVITWVFGLFALVEGVIVMLLALFKHKEIEDWGLLFIQGLVGMIIGLVIFSWPDITVAALFFLIALWVLVMGVVSIVQGLRMRKELGAGEWFYIAGGVVGLLFAIFLLSNPQLSLALAGILVGLVMLVSGIFTTASGFQLKRFEKKAKKAGYSLED